MSSGAPILPGVASGSGGISDVVSQDDLTRFAQIAGVIKYLTAPLSPPAAPSSPVSVAPSVMSSVFLNTYAALTSAGVDQGPAYLEAARKAADSGSVGLWAAFLIALFSAIFLPLAKVMLGAVDAVRKGIDPSVGVLAVEVLNEFLGTSFTVDSLPLGIGTGDHLARAQTIGALLYSQLEAEFAPPGGKVVAATAPAQTFAGLAVNFGLASGIMGIIGGSVPGGFHLDELRELGEEVAKNIGLGRLVRRALTPLIQIMVAQPLTWAINTKYLPTQFGIGELVNPYTATTMSQPKLYAAMHLLGYEDDKIAAFIQMHEKKLTPGDVQTLINWGFWTAADGQNYIARQGWPGGFAGNVLTLEGLHEVSPWITKEVDLLLGEVGSGILTVNECAQVVDQFALSQQVKDVVVALANYRAAKSAMHRPARLSEAELAEAFDAGILTASDLHDRWTALGLSADDQNTRMQLILLRLAHLHASEAAKQQKYQEALNVFEENAAARKKAAVPPQAPIAPFPLNA